MKILFMCVANSARSQLAEGLARQIFPDAEIQSAGSQPGSLNPFAVQVMNEIDLDISKHFSKSYEQLPKEFSDNIDYIITLCAEEVCPIVVNKAQRLHWPLIDPASREPLSDTELLRRFREARNTIEIRLTEFAKKLASS